MKTRLLLVAAVCMSYYTQAQFVSSYGIVNNTETARGIDRTTTNNYLLSGWEQNGPYGGDDATLMLTNGAGAYIPPTGHYGGAAMDRFHSAREVTIGGGFTYVATGQTNSFGAGGDDIYFVGTAPGLVAAFQATLGGAGMDRAYCIQQVTDVNYGNCFAIVGETNSYAGLGAPRNVYMALISPAGGLLTASIIGTPNDDVGHWIEQTSDGGYIITGFTTTSCVAGGPLQPNIYVIKIAPTPPAGNIVVAWNRIIEVNPGASLIDRGYCVKEDPNALGNYIVVGETNSFGAGGFDAFVMRIGQFGAPGICLWGRGGNEHARGLQLGTSPAGSTECTVSGYSNSFPAAAPDMSAFLFKMAPVCNLINQKIYMPNNARPDFGYELATSDVPGGGYTMVGETQSLPGPDANNLLVETDIALNTFSVCELNVNGVLNNPPLCTSANAQWIVVGGMMQQPLNSVMMPWNEFPCAAVPPPAVAKIADQTENSSVFFTLSPNPSSDNVNITYDASYEGSIVKIMDAQGRLVSTITLGENSVTFDVSKYSSGIYFISVMKLNGSTEMIRFVKSE